MTVLYLIRHAHADWTPDEQRPLSARGQEDAQRVAELLGRCPITRIYSSPFRRARQTIGPLAEELGLPIHIEPDLRERKLGSGPSTSDFFAAVEQTWRDPCYSHPGGESSSAAQRRGVAVVQRLQLRHSEEHVALSTHGNLMGLVLQHHDPRIDYDFWKAMTMPDVYELRTGSGEISIVRLWQTQD